MKQKIPRFVESGNNVDRRCLKGFDRVLKSDFFSLMLKINMRARLTSHTHTSRRNTHKLTECITNHLKMSNCFHNEQVYHSHHHYTHGTFFSATFIAIHAWSKYSFTTTTANLTRRLEIIIIAIASYH